MTDAAAADANALGIRQRAEHANLNASALCTIYKQARPLAYPIQHSRQVMKFLIGDVEVRESLNLLVPIEHSPSYIVGNASKVARRKRPASTGQRAGLIYLSFEKDDVRCWIISGID